MSAALGVVACSTNVWASASGDAQQWLQRVMTAARSVNYSGTFSYQARGASGDSRITHLVDAAGDHERIEALGGSQREIVRTNDEVQRFSPETRTVVVDRAGAGRFPLRLSLSASALSEVYSMRLGDVSTVAGHEAQLLILEPRDDMRFAHRLWIDTDSGLLLKAQMLSEKGEVVEQFAFNEVNIGGAIDRTLLKPGFSLSPDWHIVNARGSEVSSDDIEWSFKSLPPGFRQISLTRRPLHDGGPEALHAVFSDGLVSISVFIEPIVGRAMSMAPSSAVSGSTAIFKRMLSDHKVTVLGEVPLNTLRRVAAGIESRRKR